MSGRTSSASRRAVAVSSCPPFESASSASSWSAAPDTSPSVAASRPMRDDSARAPEATASRVAAGTLPSPTGASPLHACSVAASCFSPAGITKVRSISSWVSASSVTCLM